MSHLVQATRAGADTGLALAGVILLALVLKYPFFEYGPRYAAATGESLVEGYLRIGRWALWLYLLITLVTAVIVQAAVVAFTAYLFTFAFDLQLSLPVVAGLVVAACGGLLLVGRFRLLDVSVKVILVLLAISTLVAAGLTLPRADIGTFRLWPGDLVGTVVPFAFLLALVGWMPSAIDISVWSSLWTLAKNETSGTTASVEVARLDFLIGYLATGTFAFAFLLLGAGVMFGTGASFSAQGGVFATQLVDLYTVTLGSWMRPVVILAVVTVMVSTSLTVVDGFPRAIERSIIRLSRGWDEPAPSAGRVYWVAMLALWIATISVLALFANTLTVMVDFATIVSFMTAPVLGYLNLRAVTSHDVAPQDRPSLVMLVWSWTGLVLLGGTAVVYSVSLVR